MEKKKEIKEINLMNKTELVDLALQLSEYKNEELEEICNEIDDESLAIILEETDNNVKKKIINFLSNNRIIDIFERMSKDDIVDILELISTQRSKELLTKIKQADRDTIRELLGYKEDTAGGIMTTEYVLLYQSLTVGEAIQKIKEIAPKTEYIETIYVKDNNRKMVGTVSLRNILISDTNITLEEIANKEFIYVEPELDQEEVAHIVSKYDLTAVPVLNENKTMVGIINVDDIVDVILEEHTEDFLKMGGVDKEETLDTTLLQSIKMRLPWLLVNLITAFLAALTVKAFEGTIAKVVALSAIMSIVTGMGGNAGTQTVSIIIRNIAMGKVENKRIAKLLVKEILLGIINGAFVGLVTGFIVAGIYNNTYLGIIIFIAMIGNLVVSGFFGLLIPILLKKMNIDPALSSSIFLTTATDVLGFFIFLGLASMFLSKLM